MNTHTSTVDDNAILAAIFDPATGPTDLPAKTGLSLHELARWFKSNAEMVAEVREFLVVRATLVASRLHLSSLNALERVTRECTDLERVRKAASTILRSLKSPANPARERGAPCVPERTQRHETEPQHQDATRPFPPLREQTPTKRPSPAERLAAMRLSKLEQGRGAQGRLVPTS